jgi:hypothetical protein
MDYDTEEDTVTPMTWVRVSIYRPLIFPVDWVLHTSQSLSVAMFYPCFGSECNGTVFHCHFNCSPNQ